MIAGALLIFPKLALGLSGFETGVSVMPLIDGGKADRGHDQRKDGAPKGRVANTRKLLLTAAAIMSLMLLVSSFVTTLLIAPADYREGGKAAGRAIASWPTGISVRASAPSTTSPPFSSSASPARLPWPASSTSSPVTCPDSAWRLGGPRFPGHSYWRSSS